jgi:hypothetical protein
VKKVFEMEKEVIIQKRKKAKELHEKGWSNRKIARYLPEQHGMSPLHIINSMFKSRSRSLFALTKPLFTSFLIKKFLLM